MSDDDDDEALELYPWAASDDERRRAFVLEYVSASPDEGALALDNLEALYKWLKDGTMPAKPHKIKSVLTPLSGSPPAEL